MPEIRQELAQGLRQRRPRGGDKWHLDEVFLRIQGELHYVWRAVDQHGVVLDVLVQGRRDDKAAKRFFKRLLKGLQYAPCDRDRQIEKLWRREARHPAKCRTPPEPLSQQPG